MSPENILEDFKSLMLKRLDVFVKVGSQFKKNYDSVGT